MEIINSHGKKKSNCQVSFTIDPADLGSIVSFTYGGNSYVYREGTSDPGHVQQNAFNEYPSDTGDIRYVAHHILTNSEINILASIIPADSPVVEYKWDFGDGVIGYGPNVTHTYITPSPETSITLTATLADGRKFYSNQVVNLIPGFQAVASSTPASSSTP